MANEEEIEISEDGVVIHNLEIDDPALSEYLSGLEDPAEGIRDLINIAFEVRSRFTMDLETQNIKDSADAVIERIEEAYEQMVEDLKAEITRLIDPENGPVIKALDKATGDNLKLLLAPEDTLDQSPIARLKVLLAKDISDFKFEVDGTLTEIKSKLGIGVAKRKTAADGTDFEAKVDAIIQDVARIYADTAEATGATAEAGGSKKGDTLVTLNSDDTQGQVCKIIWEAKTDARFKGKSTTQSPKVIDDQVKIELNGAIATRDAHAAILVLDSNGLDMSAQPIWREYEGNKLLIIVDLLMPDEELIKLAYLWGRWKSRASIGKLAATIDTEGIKNTFDSLRLRLKDLRNVKKSHNDAIKAINSAGTILFDFRKDVNSMMEDLAETINIDLEEVDLSDEDL
jgi:hypothetical protein